MKERQASACLSFILFGWGLQCAGGAHPAADHFWGRGGEIPRRALQWAGEMGYTGAVKGGLCLEIRVLEYFMAVVREQSIVGAAESLHLSQPTLSRQLRDLEAELGKQLFLRGSRKITLTEEGRILRKRAEEILSLVGKTREEISVREDAVAGEVTLGAGETHGLRFLARAARQVRQQWPQVHFQIHSGDDFDVREELDRGLIDFALLFRAVDEVQYDFLLLPDTDRFGVLLRKDDPLAGKALLLPEDLWDQPLIVPRGYVQGDAIAPLLGKPAGELNIVAGYSLLFNGAMLAAEGMGALLGYDRILNVSGESELCFRPLSTARPIPMRLVWKRHQAMSKAAAKFLEQVREGLKA